MMMVTIMIMMMIIFIIINMMAMRWRRNYEDHVLLRLVSD